MPEEEHSFEELLELLRETNKETEAEFLNRLNIFKNPQIIEDFCQKIVEIIFQGNLSFAYQSLHLLIRITSLDYVKNSFKSGEIEKIYFEVYSVLLILFSRLDLNLENIESDYELKEILEYMKKIDFEKITSSDFSNLKETRKKFEVLLDFHLSDPIGRISFFYNWSKKKIEEIFNNDPQNGNLYFDLYYAKIYLVNRDWNNFREMVKKIEQEEGIEENSILHPWIKLFSLLLKYLDNPSDETIKLELNKLKEVCRIKNNYKMVNNIEMYQKLCSTYSTIEQLKERFSQTAFIDIFEDANKGHSEGSTPTPIQKTSGDPPDSPASMPRKLKSKKREEEEL